MIDAEELFEQIGEGFIGAVKGQLFGKRCFKINGKAFCCFFQNCMVFKMDKEHVSKALVLEGAKLFDPSGKNRPMKEWVQIPIDHKDNWKDYAEYAFKYVENETN